jgi:hypothetical protein
MHAKAHTHTMPHYYDPMILLLSPVRRESRLKIGLRNSSSITAALKLLSPFLMCIFVAEWRAESHTHSNTK